MPTTFIAFEVSRQMLIELRPILAVIARHDRQLKNQVQDAATSVHLNLGESRGRRGGDRRRCFEIAAGSAGEVDAGLDVAVAWGWIAEDCPVRRTVGRLGAILCALCRS